MRTPRATTDVTEVTSGSDKAIILDGIKFQYDHLSDPATWQGGSDPSITEFAFILSIWEGLVLLPLTPGSAAIPAYIPLLPNAVTQSGDLADRVLWKRIRHLKLWGLQSASVPQMVSTDTLDSHEPAVRVKTKCRIDDRHALFYVRNFVHDVADFGTTADFTSCTFNPVTNQIVLPIFSDGWFKIFFHTTKR